MIYTLRNKFIRISALSLVAVLLIIYLAIFFVNTNQLESTMDSLTEMVSTDFRNLPANTPEPSENTGNPLSSVPPRGPGEDFGHRNNFFNQETRFSTRFFSVTYGPEGSVSETNTDKIATVTEEEAQTMASSVLSSSQERGWSDNFRYRVVKTESATTIYFVDGSMNKEMYRSNLITVALVLSGSGACVLILIIFFSGRAVRPVAESYEKQKQFVTDANHELKTPLTLILTNLDIAESELGKNEWLDDIRHEGQVMSELVGQLVSLSKMDEDGTSLDFAPFNLSEMMLDVTSEFKPVVESSGRVFTSDIYPDVMLNGHEDSVRRVLSIFLDNALKYCDSKGIICTALTGGRHPSISVTNSFKEVDNTQLDRLFDRFYRSNKARTSGSGFGIGLSIAKAIADKLDAKIYAYKATEGVIGFKITF